MSMCLINTPVTYHDNLGLYVKHEEQCCPGGPNFSKTRGVYARIAARPEQTIGVLDTNHSQGGHAVARACQLLGKQCELYYPVRKKDVDKPIQYQQQAAAALGAKLIAMPAERSFILYNRVLSKFKTEGRYMMPNALKLHESVSETAAEVDRTKLPDDINAVLISASSGTIAAGVILGLADAAVITVVHMGYSRPESAVRKYLDKMVNNGVSKGVTIIDEGYSYADAAPMDFDLPDFGCNKYYDLKTYRWWLREGQQRYGKALLWNIG
jgi:threonine dehydratase